MNKSSLKILAIEARKELMEKMRTRLEILGITKNGIEKAKVIGKEVEVKGTLYPKESYDSLIRKYKQVGYEELIEESAYTWFNRLTALAFMEANGYIDEKIIPMKLETDNSISMSLEDGYYISGKLETFTKALYFNDAASIYTPFSL